MRGLYLVVGLVTIVSISLNAQTTTSLATGDWHAPGTWSNGVPTATHTVNITSGHIITIRSGIDAEALNINLAVTATNTHLIIESGGSLTYTGNVTLGSGPALRGKLTVNGLLSVEQGATMTGGIAGARLTIGATGTYRHNYSTTAGTIYTATWVAGSTLEIAGYTTFDPVLNDPASFVAPAGLNQTFSNFTWNCTGQLHDMYLAGTTTTVLGNYTVASTGGGLVLGMTQNANTTLTISGNLSVATGAYLDLSGGSVGLVGPGNVTINLRGDLNVDDADGIGNYGVVGGTATVNFSGTLAQSYNSAAQLSSEVNFAVLTNSTLNIPEANSIQTIGSFTLQSGATLGVASLAGLVTGQSDGAIRTFGPRNYNSGGNIVYNGTSPQSLGDEWGPTGELDGIAVNLEISNPTSVTNNASNNTSLVGRLRLSLGALNIGNSNTLVIEGDFDGYNGTTRLGTISGDGSNTSNLSFGGTGTITGTLTFTTGANILRNLTISRSDDVLLGSTLTIASGGVLLFTESGNLRLNGNTLTVIGDIDQDNASGGIASAVTASNLVIGGNGALTALPLCNCPFTNEFNNITLTRTGGATYTWNSPGNINGTLDIVSGTFNHASDLVMATGSTLRRSAGTTYTGDTPDAITRYSVAYQGTVTTSNELPAAIDNLLENLTVAGNVSLDKEISVNGNLTINSGTLNAGAHNITMLGPNFVVNGGAFSMGSSNAMIFARSGTVALSGAAIGGVQFGNFVINSGTSVDAPNANIGISGTWSNAGTFIPHTGTVTFNGTTQTIDAAGQSFFNMSTASGVKTLSSALDVNGQLTITTGSTISAGSSPIDVAGPLLINSSSTLSAGSSAINVDGQLTIEAGSTLLAGTSTINVASGWLNQGTFTAGTGTVVFDGATQTIDNNGQVFYDLTIATAASTKTLGAALDVDNQIQILANATLDVAASNFPINVGGNFINSGTFNAREGTVFLDGALIQNLGGSTVTTFNNVTSSNSSTVTVASPQSIAGVLTLTAGTFNPNDNLILRSSSTRDAQIAPLSGGATILTGPTNRMTVERFLPNNTSSAEYRYLAAPVNGATMHNATIPTAGWKDDFPITGPFTDPSTVGEWPAFPTMNVGNTSIYRYHEPTVGSTTLDDRYQAYPLPGTSTTASTIESGRGYAVFVRHAAPVTIEILGTARINNVTVPVSNTNQTQDIDIDGWNLVGNPYASAIDWDNVSTPPDAVTIAVRDNTNSVGLGPGAHIYYTQGGGLAIPSHYTGTLRSGQGFWVHKTTPGTANITFEENDKVAAAQFGFMREGVIDLLRINVAAGSIHDELIIHFNQNATDNADGKLDAFKLDNEFINFSSLSADGKKLAINSFGPLTCAREIPLALTDVTSGDHKLMFTEFESFAQRVVIRLADSFTGDTFTVTEASNIYDFEVTSDVKSFAANRFKLFIGYHDLDLGLNAEPQNICETTSTDARILLQAPQTGVIYHATLNGTVISEEVVATGGSDLTISIPKANLTGSENNIMIMAKIAGCGALPLEQPVMIGIQDIPVISNTTGASRCGTGEVTLKAEGAPSGGGYNWYLTEDATDPIAGETGSSFATSSLDKTKTFFVSAVNSLGCEGGRMAVTATVIHAYDIAGVTGAQVCAGESSTVSATGAPDDGSYHWYVNQDSVEPIPNQSAASFATTPLSATTTYYVATVNSEGCESARVPVTVEVISLEDATITTEGNVLTSNSDSGNQWHLNGTAIPGATGKTHTATENGIYKLVVTNGSCTTQTEREFAVTGDIDIAGSKGVLLYPNPSNGAIYIEVATIAPVAVSVTNQLGTEVAGGELKQEDEMRKGQFDITGHASGMYLVVIKSGDKTVVRKIIKY